MINNTRKRGRPLGYKLSEETKTAIRCSKVGQKHSQETKDKISKSLLRYFRKKNPLSVEMENSYGNYDEDGYLLEWIEEMREFIDSSEDILTYRSVYNMARYEHSTSVDVESISHEVTPELLLMFKQHCLSVGVSMDILYDSI